MYMSDLDVKIGDKVIRNYRTRGSSKIGTVVNITKKRRDIVVDYGTYKETYRSDGIQKGCDIWSASYIKPLTPEIEEEIRQRELIRKCRNAFEAKKDLTVEQAKKILEILGID